MGKHIEEIPWHKIVEGFYDKDLEHYKNIVKVIYNGDKTRRAVILHNPNELYIVFYEKLSSRSGSGDEEYLQEEIRIYGGCWLNNYTSIFDTLERAIKTINQCYGFD
ncbi:MAG: hypothetical protein FWD39_00545 [Clostridiales bacterium]|nr:hypothetical protein [Clostridiales bacterium]